AHQTMPPVKPCVAVGIETPIVTLVWAAADKAVSASTPAPRMLRIFFMNNCSCCCALSRAQVVRAGGALLSLLVRVALQARDDDDHDPLHRRVQVHADDAGEVQDVADDREQDRADHGTEDAA